MPSIDATVGVFPVAPPHEPIDLRTHAGYARVFAPSRLSVGLILPLETHPDRPAPSMYRHVEMAQRAERLGFACLWMRDIPFFDPKYGDVGQIFESLTYLAFLAAQTSSIALGTAGIVLPIREPLLLAKQVATLDQLSVGRMLLGLSSGDRPSDYPLHGIDMATRGERLRDAYAVYRCVTEHSFPSFDSRWFGHSEGEVDLVPKPPAGRTPAIAIGRGQQSTAWIAEHMDGFIASVPPPSGIEQLAQDWAGFAKTTALSKPLGVGGFVDLVDKSTAPLQRIQGGVRCGISALSDYLEQAQEFGIAHFAMNLRVSRRPFQDVMDEIADGVLRRFPSHGIPSASLREDPALRDDGVLERSA
ncbi:TIGR03571 family LLM class oxidoreductase [Variovorax saccharolyticus]|uniref:TIGR03571 family LLM class oxidoreductase n=1 Tax=Variovorax saccharolyticus TaxID=3053516 RepID=UPI002578D6A6|nr:MULTISPECIES: TIGR03571 family LLM class oxidoreductase [unclassified Variovorax]MDM0022253.1 TIGR03571 family LLM class oxidoreductase [Variovorax sp. J22R187]MDM0028810.1 TIGR03571 family LLM class oxidoreductase [Variovorax sp. J31P216]